MKVTCSICLDELTSDSDLVSLTVCGHIYDSECITQCLMINKMCPLCNQSTSRHHPAFQKVHFSITDGSDNDDKAIKNAKAETEAVKAANKTLHKEYDHLAIKLTVARDEIIKINYEKTGIMKDLESLVKQNVVKDEKMKKLTQDFQASTLKIKEENNKTTLKLIAKDKSVNLLIKNLEVSNDKIKSLKEEIIDQQQSINENDHLRYGKGWKSQKQNYDSKYADLNKKHRALKEKMFQLEKKFIDLTISTSVPELNSNRTQQLEKQLSESKAKEVKLLKEVMKFKQIKQEVIEEKLQLQERLNNSEMVIDTLVDTMTKYT